MGQTTLQPVQISQDQVLYGNTITTAQLPKPIVPDANTGQQSPAYHSTTGPSGAHCSPSRHYPGQADTCREEQVIPSAYCKWDFSHHITTFSDAGQSQESIDFRCLTQLKHSEVPEDPAETPLPAQ